MGVNIKGPGPRWYSAMNKLTVDREIRIIKQQLTERPDLEKELAEKIKSFIVWAAKERLNYQAELDEEVVDFLSGKFDKRKRLHQTNAGQWKKIITSVFKRDNYTCLYCGASGGVLECDHVVPFSKGGSDDPENLVTSCFSCNRSKRNKSVEEFEQWKKKNEK